MIDVPFITVPNCVQSAKARKVIGKVQPDFPEMRVEYLDVTQHPVILQTYRVLSSPGIVIDGMIEYTGGFDEAAFRTRLKTLSDKGVTA
jgi:glutaredoxin